MLAICSMSGCILVRSRPIHPDDLLIKEVQAAPGELIIRCEPPLASALNVDKMKIRRKDGVLSVQLYRHMVGFSGRPVALDPMRLRLKEGDRSMVFTDGTSNREIWNATKGVLDFESGFYHPPPPRNALPSEYLLRE